MATKKNPTVCFRLTKLLNSDMNSLCPFIFKATSKKKLYKLFFFVSIYSCTAGRESWHGFTDIMLVSTGSD